jgi:hypothetical protein
MDEAFEPFPRPAGNPIYLLGVLLGIWLFASAFLLPEDGQTGFNTWLTGLFIAMTSACALWAPAMRWGSTFLAAWLAASEVFIFQDRPAVVVNDLLVAMAVFAVSLAPPGRALRRAAPAAA